MQTQTFLAFAAFLSISTLVFAQIPTPTFVVPPPPGETYVVGFPICGVAGYTVIPGNDTETIEQQSGSNLRACLDQCRASKGACLSIAFNQNYTECLFFDRIVEGTQLTNDSSSNFVHYDLICPPYY